MNPLSDDELVALLDDLESDRVERKRAWSGSAPDKVREAVCAFGNDLPFDIRPVHHAALSDLSRTIFEEEYLSGAFAADVLAANQRSYEQRLAACRMIASADDPVPTVLGLITLARQPTFFCPAPMCSSCVYRERS